MKNNRPLKKLAEDPEWRQEFSAVAALVKTETRYVAIIKWMKQYQSFVPTVFRWLPYAFSILSVGVITAYALGAISEWHVLAWSFLGFGIVGSYFQKINKLSSDTTKILSTFQQYQKLIVLLEERSLQSDLLATRRAVVLQEQGKSSEILRRFARLLNVLDQRNNFLVMFLGNSFLLHDLLVCHKIEKWISTYGSQVEDWFRTIAFFDAYNALGNFAFNHPQYCFPEISNGEALLKVTEAVHPLLDPNRSVANDFEIGTKQFFIITGANMAGKSTFLRTVALQIVMANLGLPVAAKKANYKPIKLITSMRTTDSLTDDESYFFSELKRL